MRCLLISILVLTTSVGADLTRMEWEYLYLQVSNVWAVTNNDNLVVVEGPTKVLIIAHGTLSGNVHGVTAGNVLIYKMDKYVKSVPSPTGNTTFPTANLIGLVESKFPNKEVGVFSCYAGNVESNVRAWSVLKTPGAVYGL